MPSVTDPQYQAALVLFSRQLRQIRRMAGDPSQEELARQIGVAKSTVCRMLKGYNLPRWAVLERFLQVCGVEDIDGAKARWISIRELIEPVDQFELAELAPAEEQQRLARLPNSAGHLGETTPPPANDPQH
jgi:transcriptional regulator with XRE-family HTH domain